MTAPAARDDLARALLDARAENDRLRADAQAAVALVLEQAGLAVANVEIGFHDGISGEWHPMAGPSIISAACAAIRSLAPAGSLAAVEALRKERDLAVAQNDRLWAANHNLVAEQDALTAELDAAQQREAGLLEALTPSGDTKAAYMGEIKDPDTKRMVSWTAIKMVMAMVSARAALSHGGRGGDLPDAVDPPCTDCDDTGPAAKEV